MSVPESEEYLRGYRDALNTVIAKIRDDPLVQPTTAKAAVRSRYQNAVDIEELEEQGFTTRRVQELEAELAALRSGKGKWARE